MQPLYSIQGLSKHFDIKQQGLFTKSTIVKAVNDINLTIYRGETLGIVGESGCGKSTLGRLMIRILEPTAGRIVFDDTDISCLRGQALKEQKKRFQMIFQDPYASMNPRLSIRTTLEEPYRIHQMYGKSTKGKLAELMDRVGLSEEHLNRYPHEFSGGQRQRVGIARALALNPDFIVADEPVASLDVSIQAQILNLMMKIREETNITYAFIAHDLSVVKYISHRVAVMYLGNLIELAPTSHLFSNPSHPYTRGLLSAVPVPDPAYVYNESETIEGEIPSPLTPPAGCPFHPRCRHRMHQCSVEKPTLSRINEAHQVACWLYPPTGDNEATSSESMNMTEG